MALYDRPNDPLDPDLGRWTSSSFAGAWLPLLVAVAVVVAIFALFMPTTNPWQGSKTNTGPSVRAVEPTPVPSTSPAIPTPNPTTEPRTP
jgi:hypothetical protein